MSDVYKFYESCLSYMYTLVGLRVHLYTLVYFTNTRKFYESFSSRASARERQMDVYVYRYS